MTTPENRAIRTIREHLSVLVYLVQNDELTNEIREERCLEEIRKLSRVLDRLEAMK